MKWGGAIGLEPVLSHYCWAVTHSAFLIDPNIYWDPKQFMGSKKFQPSPLCGIFIFFCSYFLGHLISALRQICPLNIEPGEYLHLENIGPCAKDSWGNSPQGISSWGYIGHRTNRPRGILTFFCTDTLLPILFKQIPILVSGWGFKQIPFQIQIEDSNWYTYRY